MSYQKNIIFSILILSCLPGKTPFEYTIGITGGYDNNVLRFSDEEFNEAASDNELMGGASTFDSFVTKLGISGKKSLWNSGKKDLFINGFFTHADYRNNPERKYWSGGLDANFKWGSYRNIKYSLRHLDSFYLRHYVDRDVSIESLAPCAFTDRKQTISLTQKNGRNIWTTFSAGYLQRYYDKPFTEFDLDINFGRWKINKKFFKKIGTVSVQYEFARAVNHSLALPDRPSSFDRSYDSGEWYIPVKIQKRIPFLNEIGFSWREEFRVYEAEAADDPLHAGRSHLDTKYDFWVKKNLSESVSILFNSRFRTRDTDSAYEWVKDLKSFKQIQFWCKIEWDLIYDRY